MELGNKRSQGWQLPTKLQSESNEFVRKLREELGEVDESQGVCWLDAIENQAITIGDAVTTELVEKRSVNRLAEDESICPKCGKQGRYRGNRPRKLITRRGPAMIAEPEYFCPCCRKAFFPDDPGDRC